MDDLEKRVNQYMTMSLPGQGFSIHMGTSTLIHDLWQEIQKLRQGLVGEADCATPEKENVR